MKLSITRAHALTPRLVEVEAKGPRGGDYHFALYYDRGSVTPNLRLVVETDATERTTCREPGDPEMPPEVLQAAFTELKNAA